MRYVSSVFAARIASVLVAMSVGAVQAQAAHPASSPQDARMVPPAALAADCGTQPLHTAALLACSNRALFKGVARTHVRIQRLVLIGQMCGKLAEDDAKAILRNSSAELDEARAELSARDQDWAAVWQEALLIGATQSAAVTDAVNDAACTQFAEPGGLLTRIMTWSGKPQIVNGIMASPRTFP